MTLLEIYMSLPRPTAEGCFTVEVNTRRFRVGRSFEGFPALLIVFDGEEGESLPRRLANLGYRPPSEVQVTGDSGSRSERLAVLECRSADPDLIAYFFRVLLPILVDDPAAERAAGFETALDAISNLFRALQQPAKRSVQGLWAELAIIVWANRADVALTGWHSNPRALHDFGAGAVRFEVKGTSLGVREHTFRLDQLATVEGGVTLVASLLLDESEAGSSVFDLVDAIRSRVGPGELLRRLETIVADCLGSSWREAGELRFDLQRARDRALFFDARGVPSVPSPLPPEVKDVTFSVDLSTTTPLSLTEARGRAAFFRDVLPPS